MRAELAPACPSAHWSAEETQLADQVIRALRRMRRGTLEVRKERGREAQVVLFVLGREEVHRLTWPELPEP